MDGYLNVLKPPGWTSHDVVGRLRRLTGVRRIGHTGTLDPSAIGVLPVALGHATRTVSSPVWSVKEYLADVRFGSATDTDDGEGAVIADGDPEAVDLVAVRSALWGFIGPIHQRPPAYSAVHVGGERAYRRARRGSHGPLPERVVHIDGLSIVRWQPPILTLRMQCGSGTYVRALARDLGAKLGCPAHLGALVRLRVGSFALRDALDLLSLEAIARAGGWEPVIWPVDVACQRLSAIAVPQSCASALKEGRSWTGSNVTPVHTPDELARAYSTAGALVGLARWQNEGWHPTSRLPAAQVQVA
jgi:tRNA pseudouridine55 synthase